MPARKEDSTAKKATSTKAQPEMEKPSSVKKSALVKKAEDLLTKAHVISKVDQIEEREMNLQGVKTRIAFISFKDGKGKEPIKEVLWVSVTTDLQGYYIEVSDEDEVLMFYKA